MYQTFPYDCFNRTALSHSQQADDKSLKNLCPCQTVHFSYYGLGKIGRTIIPCIFDFVHAELKMDIIRDSLIRPTD